jgi:hypothetical protein
MIHKNALSCVLRLVCVIGFFDSFYGALSAVSHFCMTGDVHDLVSIKNRVIPDIGKITILTQPISVHATQDIRGHTALTSSVLRGCKKLQLDMNYNPRTIEEVGDHVVVLVDVDALRQCIALKRQGRIKTLIVGPNIMGSPHEHDHILGAQEVDCYLVPSLWARDWCIKQEPLIKDKTLFWYAGVDSEYWQPCSGKHKTKTMLVYWKNEPESFCVAIENMLHKYGWQTQRLRYGYYSPEQYKSCLEHIDGAVFISASESQGITLAECWSMNIPTLVWDRNADVYYYEQFIPCNSVPYLTSATGCFWQTLDDLELLLVDFESIKNKCEPRSWVLDYMTDQASIAVLLDLIFLSVKVIK